MSNDLIAELEEAVRREKLEKAAKEYGPYILAGCLLAILVTGFSVGWTSWQTRTNAAHTTRLIESGENPHMLGETAAALGGGQALVGHMAAAGLYLQQDNKDEARAAFQKAAAIKNAPAILRDMAILQTVRLSWDQDGADAQDMLKQLAPLTAKNNPWQAHARLQSAIIAAHGLKDYQAARQHLAPVLDYKGALPPALLLRARALDHVYGLKAQERAAAAGTGSVPASEG